jgi:hypothetical protein
MRSQAASIGSWPTGPRAARASARRRGGTTNVGGDTINITPAGGVTYEQMAAFFTARDQRLQRDLPMLTARSQSRFGLPRR